MLLVSGATRTMDRLRGQPNLGRLLRPGNGNSPDELPWAVDNGAFAGFDEKGFTQLLARLRGACGCQWVVAPDVVADASATLALFDVWEPRIRAAGFPVAFVLQDGQDSTTVPWDRFECLFLGGSTEYKLGRPAEAIAREAKRRGKLLHVGRVNSIRRLAYAHTLGADSIDGTAFSRFPDTWIQWALDAIRRIEAQGLLPLWTES
jgi:hypothetical protein